ncbi:MAG TPA: expansin EXLX1 family cellulose-binding protein [Actinoplanes sp.]|nr:expansin EXLX1 family cellulose-binding protein [Actinoplanes sp.]
MTAHRLLSPRWLATGGAVVLAGVLGIALLLDHSPACAAPPTSSPHKGKATFYDLAGAVGNCNFKPPADDLYVALGRTEYSSALSCGSYIDVTGPKGKVRVKVFDSCPECTVGWLDLSRTAFKKIADPVAGVVPITYKAVPNAATPGPLSITFAKGSSRYWWAILIDNHANPIKSVQAKRPGGSWMTASHADYNFWIIDHDTGGGPFSIKMTDIYGHTATATNVKLQPGTKQATSVRLTSGSSVGAATPTKKKPTPSPSTKKASPAASSAAPVTESTTAAVAQEPPVALAAAPTKRCG